jgi:hypothetical protein
MEKSTSILNLLTEKMFFVRLTPKKEMGPSCFNQKIKLQNQGGQCNNETV